MTTRVRPYPTFARSTTIAVATALLLIGVVGIGLAFAFQLVPSIASRGGVTLAPSELELSRRLASIAWLPAALGLVHVIAGFGILSTDRRWQHVVLVLTGTGAVMSVLAVALLWSADLLGTTPWLVLAGVLVVAHLVALVSALVRHRLVHPTPRPRSPLRTARA